MSWPKIKDIASSVNSGQASALDNVNKALDLLVSKSEYDTVISLTDKAAKTRARAVDDQVKNGKSAGRLAGVPFIAKDNLLVFGSQTTAASNILQGFNAPYQATAINKLEAEGAICIAKANLDAFGHGASTENSDFFVTKNPFDKTRVAGGSSGGSAASVALNIVPFSVGTDTGGSIRLPSSFCGVVGYKPTYGLVSRSGVIAMISSTDTVGSIASSVDDAALVMDVISGQDSLDSTTIDKADDDISDLTKTIPSPRVGIMSQYFDDGLSPGVRRELDKAISKIKATGATVEEVVLPSLPLALAAYYIICPAEVSSNLSRYDGQRFGFSVSDAKNLEASYKQSRSLGFGKEAKRRLMIGTYVLSSGYYDAYYKQAQTVRTMLINEFKEAFTKYDFLIGPNGATTAFKIGERSADPLSMYLTDIMTVAASLVGIPAITIPAGQDNGLPVGLQIMAKQRDDHRLLTYAKQVEELLS